jgi:hypothetical protein
MLYAELTCHWCGKCFEELPFVATCSRCYSTKPDVRAIVDAAYPNSPNPFAQAKYEALRAEVR